MFAHLACAVRFRVRGPTGDRVGQAFLACGVVLAGLIVAAFMGAFYDIDLPAAYRALGKSFL